MAQDQVLENDPRLEQTATPSRARPESPQQVIEQIADLLYESADAVAQLRDRLGRLADQIESRFAAEERSERFDEVLCHAPWLTARAQEFQQQHMQLVEALRGIQRMCDSDDSPVAWAQRVRREFEDFSERLREHQAGESNLLREMHSGPDWSND